MQENMNNTYKTMTLCIVLTTSLHKLTYYRSCSIMGTPLIGNQMQTAVVQGAELVKAGVIEHGNITRDGIMQHGVWCQQGIKQGMKNLAGLFLLLHVFMCGRRPRLMTAE